MVKQIKRTFPTIEQVESSGEWASARTALKLFGFGHDLLSCWRLHGCPQIHGGKIETRQVTALVPGIGTRPIWFYHRDSLAAIARGFEGRSRKAPAPYGRPRRHGAAIKKTKQRWANNERFTDAEGREWVAPRIAANYLKVKRHSLHEWRRSGCPHLTSGVISIRLRDDGFGRRIAFYSQSELDELKQNLAKLQWKRKPAGNEQLTLAQAAKFTGLHEATLCRMRKSGELTEGTILLKDGTGHVHRQVSLLRSELVALKKRKTEYISVAEAARQLQVSGVTIRAWTCNCPHLNRPLDQQQERVALGRRGRQTVLFVSAADVRALKAARHKDAVPPSHEDSVGLWLPLKRAVRLFGVTASRLQNLRLRGLVTAKRIETDDALAKRGMRYVYLQQSLIERFGSRDAVLSSPTESVRPADGEAPQSANPSPTAPKQADALPRWDEMTATLYWGDTPIREFRSNPAKNQRDLIEAFQRENWSRTIPDPFRNARKLNVTIYQVNRALNPKSMRFRGDGTGEGVMWEADE